MTELATKVFEYMCSVDIGCMGDGCVLSSANVAAALQCSKYAALRALHELREDGLVEKKSLRRPAVFDFNGEFYELAFEAMPPVNGFGLTELGAKTEQYTTAYNNWLKSSAD